MSKNSNGEGSIYKEKNGRWRGAVTLYCDNGVPKRKYVSGKTRREVSEKINKLITDIRYNGYIEPTKMTFYEWLCTWFEMYCQDNLKPSTLVNYETYIEKHIKPTIGSVRLCDLSPLMLQRL